MTRFARAKGSKSSNERAPEDSTPWEVMKEQLLQAKNDNEESKKRIEAENQRIENYQNFLKEQKVQKKKASWCDFPETAKKQDTSQQPPKKQDTSQQPPKKKKKKNQPNEESTQNASETQSGNNSEKSVDTPSKKKKKNKNKNKTESVTDIKPTNSNEDKTGLENENKPSKNKKSKKLKQFNEGSNLSGQNNVEGVIPAVEGNNITQQNGNKQQKKKKPAKFVDGKPIRRKEINDNSFQLIINGKEVELVRFDGFPIMKKDAERLGELKDNMIKKGIPKSEVQRTMKLERRRAEKALARMKRDVCYNCRKGGHNLSDCPDLKSKIPGVDAADGVCFKCGSTEHKQFDCKVQRDQEFKFATCFICREPGHIARQCPDNPKGLYPNGGSCKLCGDVTHLRKDCPTVQDQREETSIKLQTLDDNIEGMGIQANKKSVGETTKKPKKIKF